VTPDIYPHGHLPPEIIIIIIYVLWLGFIVMGLLFRATVAVIGVNWGQTFQGYGKG